jgi:hypothetical protein
MFRRGARGEENALTDRIFLMGLMIVAYAIGFALVRWTVGFLTPVRPVPLGLSLVMIFAPPLLCMAFEWTSRFWDNTPGAVGTGSLTVVVPMLLAGLLAGAVFLGLRALGPAVERGYMGRGAVAPLLAAWGWATVGLVAATFALYRYWPEPRARLF